MIARVIDDRRLKLENITITEEYVVIKHFSARDPSASYFSNSNFDGWYRKYDKKHQLLARPYLAELRQVCQSNNIPLTVADDRPSSTWPLPNLASISKTMLPGIILEDYQIRCVAATVNSEVGLISAPTGSGKSEIIAAIVKLLDRPTAIIAEQIVVVEQLKRILELREVVEEAGLFCAGRRPNGQRVIIGSIQSLTVGKLPDSKNSNKYKAYVTRLANAQRIRDYVGECDLLVVDEADLATSTPYRQLFNKWFKGRRRYGLSGTCFDSDKPVESLILKGHLGSVIAQVSYDEVLAAGRIIPIEYRMIAVGDASKRHNRAALDIAEAEHLLNNAELHQIIARIVTMEVASGNGVLILVEKKELGYKLEAAIPGSRFICGDTPLKVRREVTVAFEQRQLKVLIGGKIAKRGFDLKGGCEVLFIASGGKQSSDLHQKIGRAVRLNSRGRAIVYDLLFLSNHYLYDHSRRRLKTVAAAGYKAIVVFKTVVISAGELIKSRFRSIATYH